MDIDDDLRSRLVEQLDADMIAIMAVRNDGQDMYYNHWGKTDAECEYGYFLKSVFSDCLNIDFRSNKRPDISLHYTRFLVSRTLAAMRRIVKTFGSEELCENLYKEMSVLLASLSRLLGDPAVSAKSTTPGPWAVSNNGIVSEYRTVIGTPDKDGYVMSCPDAILIAQAPTMKFLLEMAYMHLSGNGSIDRDTLVKIIMVTLAKAGDSDEFLDKYAKWSKEKEETT